MARISGADLRGVFRVLAAGTSGSPDAAIGSAAIRAMEDLIGADETSYFELRRRDRAVVSHVSTGSDGWAPGTYEAMLEFSRENPLDWRRWRPSDGCLRLSNVVTHAALERISYYQFVMRPNAIRDTIKAWIWSSAESVACVRLDRADVPFTRREQDLLGVLQHHLVRMRASGLRKRMSTEPFEATLTPREAQVLSLAATGLSRDAISELLGTSPATVRTQLEHAYDKLGVHSLAEAIGHVALSDAFH